MFGMDVGPGSRARWLLLAVVVCVGAAGAALYFHESAVAPAPAEPVATDPAPAASADAVAAATAAGPEDVVTPADAAPDAAPADEAAADDGATETAAASTETNGETAQATAAAADGAADGDGAPADRTPEAESAPAGDGATDATAAADDAAPPPAAVEPEPEPDPEPEPAAPIPPSVSVTPHAVRQGQATLVVLAGDVDADDAWVSIDGYSGQMAFEEGVGWVGFVPITRLARPRLYHVVVDTFNNGSYAATHLSELLVEAEVAVIDEITLDAENAALLTPEMVAIDNHTRYEQYKAVSGPRLWSGPWGLPLVGVDSGAFGVLRSYNGGPATDWHHGHDISADAGAVIRAPARGRVVFASDLPVHGLGIILDHGAGVYSGYWHMSEIQAELGQMVNPGDPLGLVGTTGVTTGPHLHWEVIVQGTDVDPIQWTETTFTS